MPRFDREASLDLKTALIKAQDVVVNLPFVNNGVKA